MKRVNLAIDDIVLQRVDKFCDTHSISRSKLMSLAVSDYITAQEQLPNLTKDLQAQLDSLRESLMSRLDEMKIEQK